MSTESMSKQQYIYAITTGEAALIDLRVWLMRRFRH